MKLSDLIMIPWGWLEDAFEGGWLTYFIIFLVLGIIFFLWKAKGP